MKEYQIYLAGSFVKSEDLLKVGNPYTGKEFAHTYNASNEQLEKAITEALRVKNELKEFPIYKRFSILKSISEEINLKRKELAEVLTVESGKPFKYSLAEINRAAQTFLVAAEEAKRLPKEYLDIDWTEPGVNKEGLVKYFPIGLVAGISPFNFPLNLAVHKIAPAIAAGCPIILKPASPTPLSTLELAKIIDRTELPKGALSILPMNRETGNQLVTDERISLLSFTGSPVVGWKMKKEAGKKKVVLELGGNAAVIVSRSADIDEAIKKCLVAGFAYSGQVCIHAQRIFVHDSIFDEFLEKFKAGVEQLKYGDPLEANCDISNMIDLDNAERVDSWIKEAVKEGAEIVIGGKMESSYYYPTLITKTNSKMKVSAEEVFGPVVLLEKFSSFSQAVELVNDTKFGLQAGVFTNDISEMNQAFNNIDVGGVILNDVPTFRADHMPYGGIKESGLGREGVKYAIMDMMEAKILVKPKV